MELLIAIAFALAAASIAKLVMPGPNAGGFPVAVVVALGGAVLGAVLAGIVSGAMFPFDARSTLFAMAGTLALLLAYRAYAIRLAE